MGSHDHLFVSTSLLVKGNFTNLQDFINTQIRNGITKIINYMTKVRNVILGIIGCFITFMVSYSV